MSGATSPESEQLDFAFMVKAPPQALFSPEVEMLSIPEFCRISGVKRSTTFRLFREGLLVRAKIGRRSLIPRNCVDEFLEKAANEGIRY